MEEDIEDLLRVLTMRFGAVPEDVLAAVRKLEDVAQVNRLILVAGNAANIDAFRRELSSGTAAFRL